MTVRSTRCATEDKGLVCMCFDNTPLPLPIKDTHNLYVVTLTVYIY